LATNGHSIQELEQASFDQLLIWIMDAQDMMDEGMIHPAQVMLIGEDVAKASDLTHKAHVVLSPLYSNNPIAQRLAPIYGPGVIELITDANEFNETKVSELKGLGGHASILLSNEPDFVPRVLEGAGKDWFGLVTGQVNTDIRELKRNIETGMVLSMLGLDAVPRRFFTGPEGGGRGLTPIEWAGQVLSDQVRQTLAMERAA